MLRLAIFILSALSMSALLQARSISGTVVSDRDSTSVAGAICRLSDHNHQSIGGSTSGVDGAFAIESAPDRQLILVVSMTGFSPTEIIIESGSKDVALGLIYLNEGVSLEGITVNASHAISDQRGRTIIFPSASDVKASPTSLSLFQKLPLAGLEANPINRTLSVDGGSPVILINGVPSTSDDLNALKPGDIAKIEYSRITPARYADKGNSGLIAITLKERSDGGQIYTWGRTALTTAFVDAIIRASYHQGPSQFGLSYNPSWRNYQQVYDNTYESYISDDFKVDLAEHDRNPFNYSYHNLQLKYNYSPNTATLFSATFKVTPQSKGSRMIAQTLDSELGEYSNYNHVKGRDFTPSLDLFFRRDFNDNNSLEAQVVGTLSSSEYRRTNNYMMPDDNNQSYIMDVDSRRRSLISEICYDHRFSEKTSLSAGIQNTISHSNNTYLTSDYKPVLTENNNYVYAKLGQQIGSVNLSLATGAKLFWIKNDINRRNFVRNLSTVQLSWGISPKWRLSAAFRYSPGIPSLSALTDYPQQQTPYLISNGNPDLKVSQTFIYQIMLSFRHKKFSASLLVNYRQISDYVTDDIVYLGNYLFLSQSVNAGKAWLADANLNLNINDIAGFGANLNLGFDHTEMAGETWCHHINSFSGSFSVWWNKGPYTISYWRKIPGKYLSGHYVGKEENGDALSLSFKPDNHWTLEASWMYMFDTKGTKYPSWGYSPVNPCYRERYIRNNGNMVVLSVSYSTDFGSIFRSASRSLNNSDNGSSLLEL